MLNCVIQFIQFYKVLYGLHVVKYEYMQKNELFYELFYI